MIPIEVYRLTLNECINHAEELLNISRIIASRGSKAHALLLKNFAVEEIAKAYVCWLVSSEILPRNHPIAKTTSKRGVFRNHDTKYILSTTVGSMLIIGAQKGMRPGEFYVPDAGELTGISIAATAIGKIGTKKRFEWMYTDIITDSDGNWKVTSPLKLDLDETILNYGLDESMIAYLKNLRKSSNTEDFKKRVREYRTKLSKIDPEYPSKPKW